MSESSSRMALLQHNLLPSLLEASCLAVVLLPRPVKDHQFPFQHQIRFRQLVHQCSQCLMPFELLIPLVLLVPTKAHETLDLKNLFKKKNL